MPLFTETSNPVEVKTEVTSSTPNPANSQAQANADRNSRIPMSVPLPKFDVEAIPGYHLHWFAEERVPRAKQAGYELVRPDELKLNFRGIGGDKSQGGNTDLGDCVSIVGSPGDGGRRAVLMKLKEEWWLSDQNALRKRNASIVGAIFGGEAAGVKVDDKGETHFVGLPEGAYVGSRSRGITKPILNRGVKRASKPRGFG